MQSLAHKKSLILMAYKTDKLITFEGQAEGVWILALQQHPAR